MSVRKYMHPRNKYRKAPDFKQLAVLYPEFRQIAITDLSGKVRIDFKQRGSLRILTKTLLKHDFFLDVEIPENKLVPTLPLRLNYVLWIEDLMQHIGCNEMALVEGIDIGTGAVCIYPLLLAKMYGCSMIATDVNNDSIESAIHNVQSNNLQHLIKVRNVKNDTILHKIMEEKKEFHFTMCNPPFFESDQDLKKVNKKLPPRNAPTGNTEELSAVGGEKSFVVKMIKESVDIKDRIKIYSTMIGCKSNLVFLVKFLKSNNIINTVWTEFCQGYITRWGLAWTFLSKQLVDLSKAPVIRKAGDFISKSVKDEHPVEILFPVQKELSSLDSVVTFVKLWLDDLNITANQLDVNDANEWASQLTAERDTWTHARRKRRLAQQQQNVQDHTSSRLSDTSDDSETFPTRISTSEAEEPQLLHSNTEELHLVCNIFVKILENNELCGTNVKICMVYIRGTGGKNSLEGLKQHLVNKLNIREYLQCHQKTNSNKKRKRVKEKPLTYNVSDNKCEQSDNCAVKS